MGGLSIDTINIAVDTIKAPTYKKGCLISRTTLTPIRCDAPEKRCLWPQTLKSASAEACVRALTNLGSTAATDFPVSLQHVQNNNDFIKMNRWARGLSV